jgi:hypothetical protein
MISVDGNAAAPGQAPEQAQDEPEAAAIQPPATAALRASVACAALAVADALRVALPLGFAEELSYAGPPPTCACPAGAVLRP